MNADNENTHPGGEGLCYEERLPLAWQPGDDAVRTDDHVQSLNESLMQHLEALETHPDTEERSNHPELLRLERKIDILLATLGRIRAAQLPMPAATDIALYADGLAWVAGDDGSLSVGSQGSVALYLDPVLPDPLRLAGTVERIGEDDKGRRWVFLRFTDPGETLRDAIERMIFRHHRRAVAQARSRHRHD